MLRSLPIDRHALPALVAVVVSLLVPFAVSQGPVSGSATSETPGSARTAIVPAAEEFAVGTEGFQNARRIAEAHWGAPVCGGSVAISWTALDPGTNATATWRNPTDAWNNAAKNFDCVIEINTGADFDFAKLCTVLTHEVGHLAGQQHVAEDGQLMSAIYADPTPACAAAAPQQPANEDALDELESGADQSAARVATQRVLSKKRTRSAASAAAAKRCVRPLRAAKGRSRSKCARPTGKAARRVTRARSTH